MNLLAQVCDITLGKLFTRVASRQRASHLLGTQRMPGPFEAGGEFYKERTGFCCLVQTIDCIHVLPEMFKVLIALSVT